MSNENLERHRLFDESEPERLVRDAFIDWLDCAVRHDGAAGIAFFEGIVSPQVFLANVDGWTRLVVQSRIDGHTALIQASFDFKTMMRMYGVIDQFMNQLSKKKDESK